MSRFLCVIVLLCLLAFSGAHTTRTTFKKLQTKQQQRALQQDTPSASAPAPTPAATTTTPSTPSAPASSTPTAPATTSAPPAAASAATTTPAAAAPSTPAPAAAAAPAAPATPAADDTPDTPAAGSAPDPADGDGVAIAEEAKKEVSHIVDEKVQPRVDAAGNKIGLGWKEKLKQEQEKNAYYQPELKPATLADKDQELSDEEIDKMAEKDFAPVDALDAANATANAEEEGKKE